MLHKLTFLFLPACITLLLYSCGLKYTPPESAEEFQDRRHRTIERYFHQELLKDSLTYRSIAFGDTRTIKPTTFRTLDSLFEIKYQNEKKGVWDKELDAIIKEQQELVRLDTTQIVYLEYHVFSYPNNNAVQVVESEVLISRDLKIRDVTIQSIAQILPKDDERYKQFLFEESFVYPGTFATEEEELFYRYFKQAYYLTPEFEKDQVLAHILNLMEIGYKRKSIRTYDLLLMLARKDLVDQLKPLPYEKSSEIFTNVRTLENGKEEIVNYWFSISYMDAKDNKRREFYYEFDALLRMTKKMEL
jgi:hypothetical protein